MHFSRNDLKRAGFQKGETRKSMQVTSHYRENKLIIHSDWKFCVSNVCQVL